MSDATATEEAPAQPVAQAPAQPEAAPAPAPAETPAPAAPAETAAVAQPAPALSPEVLAMIRARDAQVELQKLRKAKEDACAAEIEQTLAKHGCEMVVGHVCKVTFKQQ